MPLLLAIAYLFFAWLIGFWPFNNPMKSEEALPLSEYENVRVNAYFYYPNDLEVYLGEYLGASECNSAAVSYANHNNISGDWGYVCCTIRLGYQCYEKIR